LNFEFQVLLKTHGTLCSMSQKGDCWGNAEAERFFHTLKGGVDSRKNLYFPSGSEGGYF